MQLEDAIESLEPFIVERNWDGLLSYAEDFCRENAGEALLKQIQQIDTAPYEDALKELLPQVFGQLKPNHKAVYFEYDMYNDWGGNFFLCNSYNPRDEEDDEWACDWEDSIDGPAFPPFSEIDRDQSYNSKADAGVTALLVARTFVALARPYCELERELNPNQIPLCIGFHDQDLVSRICAGQA